MTAPVKPWEMSREAGHEYAKATLGSSQPMGPPPVVNMTTRMGGPPPLPSRSGSTRRYHDNWRSPMGIYPGPMSYLGGCSEGYGYGSGYPGIMRRPYEFENRFVQMAEESSQPAFQSIEAFVRSFSSVTMMLESTYQAMHMSFRAVLSVAENMSRLRGVFTQFVSSMALLRTIHWFYRKVLYLLGLISENPIREDIWRAAEAEVMSKGHGAAHQGHNPSAWPVVTFFGLMLGGPYLMFKLLGGGGGPAQQKKEWDPSRDGGIQVVAMYDFETDMPGELCFKKGQNLLVAREPFARKMGGWILAARGAEKGMVPANRLVLIKNKSQHSSPSNHGAVPVQAPPETEDQPQEL